MGNSGGLGALDRNVWTLRAGGLVGGQQRLVGGGLEFGDGIPAEGDADCGPVGVSVVVDLELVGAEQAAQGRLWQFREAAGRDREGVEELEGVGLVLLGGERGEVLEFGLALLIEGLEVLAKFVDDQGGLVVVAVEAVVERKGTDQAALADVQIVDGALQACLPALEVLSCGLVEVPEVFAETVAAVGVEDAFGEEVQDAVEEAVLADVDAWGVVGVAARQQLAVCFWEGAAVVGVLRGRLAVAALVGDRPAAHPAATVHTAHMGAQHIGVLGVGVAVGAGAVAGAVVLAADVLGLPPDLEADDRLVGRLRRPDPVLWPVLAAGGVFSHPVPHHVAGVFGVAQQVGDGRFGPAAFGGGGPVGDGGWPAVGVAVEPLGDGLVAELLADAPGEDLGDCWRAVGVDDQAGLGLALGAFGRDRVGDAVGEVAVGWAADVVALPGVFDQAIAAGFQHLGDVPLGDGLLDAAGQQGGGVFAAAGLVGGQQQHPGALQFVFDAGAVVGEPRDPVDGLADDGVKAPVGAGGFGEQVVEATVAAQGDVELLVGAAEPAFVAVFAAGFDVVEVADDGGAGG